MKAVLTIQYRFARSRVGEAVISGLVAVILGIAVVWNLPDSEVRRTLIPVLRPVASVAGLEQVWSMYAPDPVRRLETVEVHVRIADGTDRVWTFERGDGVVGHMSWYHWRKLKENLVREPDIRASFADWVVRELTRESEQAIHVRMVLRTELLPPPGANGPTTTAVQSLYDRDFT